MSRHITFQGAPLTLIGREIKEGMRAPYFTVTSAEMKNVALDELEDKIKIITTFPSLDTPVCDLQVKEFNKRALDLADNVVIVGVSNDLPFAQKRFCNEFDIDHVLIFSDYNKNSLGFNYGVFIKELKLLARTVIILDKNNVIRFIHIVDEISDSPNYELVLEKLNEVIANPELEASSDKESHCEPCETGSGALDRATIDNELQSLPGWEVIDDIKITKEYPLAQYQDAIPLVEALMTISNEEGHHGTLSIFWNRIKITFSTHSLKAITKNDFIMAQIVEQLFT